MAADNNQSNFMEKLDERMQERLVDLMEKLDERKRMQERLVDLMEKFEGQKRMQDDLMAMANMVKNSKCYQVEISNDIKLSVSTRFLAEANNKECYPDTAVETMLFKKGDGFYDEKAGYEDVRRFNTPEELEVEIDRLKKYYSEEA